MKIRNDFVTNSSSSSFIIGIKSNTEDSSMNTFLKEMFEGEDVFGSTKEEIEAYLLYDYGYDSINELRACSDYLSEMYSKCLEAINNNMKVVRVSAEYDAVGNMTTMINALEKAGVAKLIEEEC